MKGPTLTTIGTLVDNFNTTNVRGRVNYVGVNRINRQCEESGFRRHSVLNPDLAPVSATICGLEYSM